MEKNLQTQSMKWLIYKLYMEPYISIVKNPSSELKIHLTLNRHFSKREDMQGTTTDEKLFDILLIIEAIKPQWAFTSTS